MSPSIAYVKIETWITSNAKLRMRQYRAVFSEIGRHSPVSGRFARMMRPDPVANFQHWQQIDATLLLPPVVFC